MLGDPKAVADVLGLKRAGGEYKGPCPLCGGQDRFHVKQGHQHNLIVHCRHGCQFKELARWLTDAGLVEDTRPKLQYSGKVDRAEVETFLAAFCRAVDDGVPVSSAWRVQARHAVRLLTRCSPEEFVDMYIWRETFVGNLENHDLKMTKKDLRKFMTFHQVISGKEWMIRGCACLTSMH